MLELDDPELGPAWNNRGYAYYRRGQYHQAVADLDVALRLTPNSALALGNRGDCYLNLGDYEKALDDFVKLADVQPRNGRWPMSSTPQQAAPPLPEEIRAPALDIFRRFVGEKKRAPFFRLMDERADADDLSGQWIKSTIASAQFAFFFGGAAA